VTRLAPALLRFKREHLLASAERVEPLPDLPGGLAIRTPSLPHVYDLNLVLAPATAGGRRMAAECARLGLPKLRVDGDAAGVTFPEGWAVDREITMVRRRAPRPTSPRRAAVRPVSLDELAPSEDAFLRSEPFARDPEVRRQLIAQHERWEAAAPAAERLGIVDGRRVVAWCRVYDDGALTEIDAVAVLPEERGRGLGRALMEGALERIPADRTVFLVADAEDWPRQLYARLGFDAVFERLGARSPDV
jgi:ribosomal protein S18 acetylase RimI-like enzyme